MKLIVGLGNPGKKYDNTRHNVGFMILDKYLSSKGDYIYKEKFNGNYVELTTDSNEKILFLKPLSYMNLSGQVIGKYLHFYKINVTDILIIHDDKDISLGSIKLKETGSCAGHNGLLDIENNLHTRNYKRVKVGISNNSNIALKDYVLGDFTKFEKEVLSSCFPAVFNAIDLFINDNFDKAMQVCNQKVVK